MRRVRILFTFVAMTTRFLDVNAQPVTCIEDMQCAVGFYCEATKHMCQACLSCENLNRDPTIVPLPFIIKATDCVKSCGACFKGFVNNYSDDLVSKCVSPAALPSHIYLIVWFTMAAVMGVLILIVFVRSLLNMDQFKIVIHSSLQQLPRRRRNGRVLPDNAAVLSNKSASAA